MTENEDTTPLTDQQRMRLLYGELHGRGVQHLKAKGLARRDAHRPKYELTPSGSSTQEQVRDAEKEREMQPDYDDLPHEVRRFLVEGGHIMELAERSGLALRTIHAVKAGDKLAPGAVLPLRQALADIRRDKGGMSPSESAIIRQIIDTEMKLEEDEIWGVGQVQELARIIHVYRDFLSDGDRAVLTAIGGELSAKARKEIGAAFGAMAAIDRARD